MAMHHDERGDTNAAYSKPIFCKRGTKEKQRRDSFRLCLARMKKAEPPKKRAFYSVAQTVSPCNRKVFEGCRIAVVMEIGTCFLSVR